MIVLICVFLAVAAVIALLRPQIGAPLIWFAIWLYPNTLLYGLLPLNIRLDDLWVVFMTIICLVSPFSRRQLGTLTWLAIAWACSIIIGDITGFMVLGGAAWEPIIKAAGKSLYIPMTAFVLSSLLYQEKYLRDHIRWLTVAGVAAAVLGIITVYSPEWAGPFLIRRVQGRTAEEIMAAQDAIARRARGALGSPALAAVTLNGTLLATCMGIYHRGQWARVLFALAAVCCAIGLAYTVTRGTIAALVVALVWAVVFTRRRVTFLAIMSIAAGGLVIQGDILLRILMRITDMRSGMHAWEYGWASRTAIWDMFAQNPSIIALISGHGMVATSIVYRATVHNAYLGAIFYSGILGVLVMITILVVGVRLGRRASRVKDDWLCEALGTYLLMLLVAMAVNGMVAENFQQAIPMQCLFAAMVFVKHRLDQFERDTEIVEVPVRDNSEWRLPVQ